MTSIFDLLTPKWVMWPGPHLEDMCLFWSL